MASAHTPTPKTNIFGFDYILVEELKSKIAALETRFNDLAVEVGHIKNLTIPPMLANIAAQVLFFLLEKQPLVPTPRSRLFLKAVKNNPMSEKMTSCAEVLRASGDVKSFARAADKLLDRSNYCFVASDVSELDNLVSAANLLLDADPLLGKSMDYEVMIIRHYEQLKAFFSEQTVEGDESEEDDIIDIDEELDDRNEETHGGTQAGHH
jgi:hypothetical protein